jgi:hypothetical protein
MIFPVRRAVPSTTRLGCTVESLEVTVMTCPGGAIVMLRSPRRSSPNEIGISPLVNGPRNTWTRPSTCGGRPQMRYVPSAVTVPSRTRGARRTPPLISTSYQTSDTFAPVAGFPVSASRTRPMSAAGPRARHAAEHRISMRCSGDGVASSPLHVLPAAKVSGAERRVIPRVSSIVCSTRR